MSPQPSEDRREPQRLRRRRWRAALLAPLFGATGRLFHLLGWRRAQRWGAALGAAAWRLSKRDRRRSLDHLQIAFPELSEKPRRVLARAAFRHYGTLFGEILHLSRADGASVAERVRVEGWEHVEAARRAERPILVLTGHCGNWELLAAVINLRGLRMSVVARRLDDPELASMLLALRRRFGTETIERAAPGAARRLLGVMRSGGALGMLIDQDTTVEGVWVPFFGRPAYTPVGAAKIAAKLNAAVIPTFIERLDSGDHRARFEAPLELPADPQEATARMTERIEAQIRRRPEQWVWMHRRWRRQPPAEESG